MDVDKLNVGLFRQLHNDRNLNESKTYSNSIILQFWFFQSSIGSCIAFMIQEYSWRKRFISSRSQQNDKMIQLFIFMPILSPNRALI